MRTFLIAFALAFFCGIALTWLIRKFAVQWGLYDKPEGRKIHSEPIPRLGGVAVAIAFFIPIAALMVWDNDISQALFAERELLIALVGGGSLILALGIHDDLKGARALTKLIGQITAAMVVFHAGIQIDVIGIPFIGPVALGVWAFPVTIFWIVLVTNAVNLIDGLDGLAGGVAVLAGTTLFVMSLVQGNVIGALLLCSMVGATLGFLRFNWNPASIFLGDTGSLFLGFVLALSSTHGSQKSFTLFSIVAAFVALALPIFDLLMAVVRRFLVGKPVFSADQYHVHHMLLRKGFSQRQAALMLLGTAGSLGVLSLVFIYSSDRISAISIVALAAIAAAVIHFLGYADIIRAGRRSKLFGALEHAARERALAVDEIRNAITTAVDEDALWGLMIPAGEALQLEGFRFDVVAASGPKGMERRSLEWKRNHPGAGNDVHIQTMAASTYTVSSGRIVFGTLKLEWLQENSIFDPHQVALGRILADAVAQAMCAIRGLVPVEQRREMRD
jgi:UDP-GlcNAc:undecaprenyl-phosphate GlcNAc-1-phosphate transferase